LFQLLRYRRNRQTVARGDIANHHVDVIALDEITELSDHVGGGAGLVDEFGLDFGSA
jgi:hypothetical protein